MFYQIYENMVYLLIRYIPMFQRLLILFVNFLLIFRNCFIIIFLNSPKPLPIGQTLSQGIIAEGEGSVLWDSL
jgi:hypothetical protein